MTEQELVEKLRKIELLFSGGATAGERDAAANARRRIRERFNQLADREQPVEYKFSLPDIWSRRLLVALLRRYEISPFRYSGQKRTTVMAKIPQSFKEKTLWPEYLELYNVLTTYISEVTDRIIRENVYEDCSDIGVLDETKQLRH